MRFVNFFRIIAVATGIATALLCAAIPRAATAQERTLDIRRGNFQPVSIAISNFQGEGDLGGKLTAIITNNFRRSVFLAPIDPKSFPEAISNPDAPPQADAWKTVNAQFVVTGRSAKGADGRLKTEFRLWDVTSGQQVAGQQYSTDANNARRVGHIISDAIFAKITGEKGAFGGPKTTLRKHPHAK